MKKTRRYRVLPLLVMGLFLLALSLGGLTACTEGTRQVRDYSARIAAGETLTVGIVQYMHHPSLDNCTAGIREALLSSGLPIEVDVQIGSDNSASADCTAYARSMVARRYDMIVAVATPAAQAAYAAAADTDIPVVFCSVSDPVAAGLVASCEAPGDLCTGTSDLLNHEAQLDLILATQPTVKKIGVLYTSSEQNSLSNLAAFRAVCAARGIEVVARAVQGSADIPAAAAALCREVDCIDNFTDNNVVNHLSVLLGAARSAGIPVYGSEIEQVRNGCVASESIDYTAVGRRTGEMAIAIFRGADPATLPVETVTDTAPVLNPNALASLGLALPDGTRYADAACVGGGE